MNAALLAAAFAGRTGDALCVSLPFAARRCLPLQAAGRQRQTAQTEWPDRLYFVSDGRACFAIRSLLMLRLASAQRTRAKCERERRSAWILRQLREHSIRN
jgi:hypothetical protein